MTLAEFLLKLACDSDLLRRFAESREELMREFDLTEQQRRVLLAGDLRELRFKITAELELEDDKIAFTTIHTVPTIYAPQPPPDPEE